MAYTILILPLIFVQVVTSNIVGFIANGDEASVRDIPHAIFLSIMYKSLCGGSILNQILVITAAHCLENCDKSSYCATVHYGDERRGHMKRRQVENYQMHEKYNEFTLIHDIALVYVRMEIVLGRVAKRVVIVPWWPSTKRAKTYGWGVVNENVGKSSQILMEAEQEIQPSVICRRIFKSCKKPSVFCAKPWRSGFPAKGDSGGALVANNYIQIGLVSHKRSNSDVYQMYVAYTNVSYHFDWIKTTSAALVCETY